LKYMFLILIIVSVFLVIHAGNTIASETEGSKMKQQECKFEAQVLKTVSLKYLLYLPKSYGEDSNKKWPLILFLHGAGERGSDLNMVKVHGIPKIVEQKDDFPFIAVSPQCPKNSWWTAEVEAMNALLDDIISRYTVDTERIYLTGLSMGGYGTWALAIAYPDRFAAIAPICGGGDIEKACTLKNIPVWVFHGAKDNVVNPEESQKMVKAMEDCGGNVKLTIYPEAGHDSWTEAYNTPELYEWLLKHKREKK
jgi:predicted peptidase